MKKLCVLRKGFDEYQGWIHKIVNGMGRDILILNIANQGRNYEFVTGGNAKFWGAIGNHQKSNGKISKICNGQSEALKSNQAKCFKVYIGA